MKNKTGAPGPDDQPFRDCLKCSARVLPGRCPTCRRKTARAHYRRNAIRIRAQRAQKRLRSPLGEGARKRQREYYERNRARLIARMRDYRILHRNVLLKRKRQQYRENPSLYRERNRINYEKHQAARDNANRLWIARNRQRRARTLRRYLRRHPEYARVQGMRRRAMLNARGGPPSFTTVRAVMSAKGCFDCGKPFIAAKPEVGHLVPVCWEGSNDISNIVAQCHTCNSKQGVSIHPKSHAKEVNHATLYIVGILGAPMSNRKRAHVAKAATSLRAYWKKVFTFPRK